MTSPPTPASAAAPQAGPSVPRVDPHPAEVRARDHQRLGASCVLCACGTLIFFLADLAVAPAQWRPLLAVRLATTLVVAAVGVWRRRASPAAGGHALLWTMGASTVALAGLAGGAVASYHQPLALVFLGYGMLMATTVPATAGQCAALTALYAAVLVALGTQGERGLFVTQAVVLLAATLMASFFVAIRNGLQRREAQAAAGAWASQRALDARHVELAKSVAAQEASHRQLAEALARLRASEAARSQFFAYASHELRTPLTLIIASIDLLDADAADADAGVAAAGGSRWAAQVKICQRNGMRLLHLVDDILELVGLEAGSFKLRWETVSLGDMLRELVEEVAPYAARRHLSVVGDDIGAAAGEVIGDRSQLERVVLNLLANAIKFSRDTGEIRLAMSEDATHVAVSVADTGVGIAAEALPRIFEHGKDGVGGAAAAAGARRGGVGIGLSLARQLVEAHQGTIGATSRAGAGTTISFRLPRRPQVAEAMVERRRAELPASGERRRDRGLAVWDAELRQRPAYRMMQVDQASEPRPEAAATSGSPATARILVVDDNPSVLDLVGSILAGQYTLAFARDGEEALAAAAAAMPALILSDYMMPRMNGMALLQAVRASPTLREVPFVLLTARGQADDRVAATQEGASAYLAKPFHPRELLAVIGRLLSDREDRAQSSAKQRETGLRVMADGIAHEVLNPLGLVSNAVHILGALLAELVDLAPEAAEARARVAGEAGEFLQSAAEGLSRAKASIGQLRQFSRQSGSEPAARVAVNDAVGRAVMVVRGRGVITQALDGAPEIMMPPGQLEQVLLNLLLNAVEAGGDACPVRVTTRVDVASAAVVLAVEDGGPGMDPATLAKVFEPYFTTKERGTGLGLALCRRMVHDIGGQMRAESTPKVGTVVTLQLPLAPPLAAASGEVRPHVR